MTETRPATAHQTEPARHHAAEQSKADKDANTRREDDLKAAADFRAESRADEDEAIAKRRADEDEALADKRTEEDRVLASARHRLFLAAAAMTAAVNSGDIDQANGANGELQEAVDAYLSSTE